MTEKGAPVPQGQKRLAYVIHEAVCTAYKHEGRNALCERAAIAIYTSEWIDALAADAKAGWIVDTRDTHAADSERLWVGAEPPYSVTYIDPKVVGGKDKTDRWFVMGTLDGDPRNPQGPVAICEYEPAAHAIAALLNDTVDGYVTRPLPPAKTIPVSDSTPEAGMPP